MEVSGIFRSQSSTTDITGTKNIEEPSKHAYNISEHKDILKQDRLKNQRFFNRQICALPKLAGFGGRWRLI